VSVSRSPSPSPSAAASTTAWGGESGIRAAGAGSDHAAENRHVLAAEAAGDLHRVGLALAVPVGRGFDDRLGDAAAIPQVDEDEAASLIPGDVHPSRQHDLGPRVGVAQVAAAVGSSSMLEAHGGLHRGGVGAKRRRISRRRRRARRPASTPAERYSRRRRLRRPAAFADRPP